MIIGFDGRFAQNQLSGVGKYIKNLVEGVAHQGFKCIVFYSQKPKHPIIGKNIKNRIIKGNKYIWEQAYLPQALKQEKIDIYHATGNVGIPLFCPVPSVLTVHDLIPLIQKNYFSQSRFPPLSKKLYFWRTKTSLWKAQKIITDTKWTKKNIIKFFKISSSKITVIYLNSSLPKKLDDKVHLRFNLKKENYIINNGGIDRRKNLANLISAFALVQAKIPPIKLVITGQNRELLPILKKEIQQKKLTQKIIFTGFLKEETLWGLLKNALCLCYPSEAEGFGLPIIEAFHTNTPVIASDIPVLREIGDSACLFVNQNQPQKIAQAVIKLIQNPKLQKELITCGQKQARIFSWEKTIEKTIKIYNNLIKNF